MVLKLKLEGMTKEWLGSLSAKFQNFGANQQKKLTRSFKILPAVGVFLSQGYVLLQKKLPQGRDVGAWN